MRSATAPARRLLRLQGGAGADATFAPLDGELRADLAAWLRADPEACSPAIRAEIAANITAQRTHPAASGEENTR